MLCLSAPTLLGHRTRPAEPITSDLSLDENSAGTDFLGSSTATSARNTHFYNNCGQTDNQLCDGYT